MATRTTSSDYLTSKGFYVATESRSNYMKTVALAGFVAQRRLSRRGRARPRAVGELGHRSTSISGATASGAFLRSQGYSYTHLGSWFYPTRENPQATRNVNYYTMVPRAALRLFDSQAFSPVQRAFGPWLDDRLQNWHRVRRQLDDMTRLVPTPGPKFVFLHILVPHPPYVFDRDGSYVTKAEERKRSLAENYTNQVQAANAMIRRLVDGIFAMPPSPPVVIVQGDEGPYPPGTGRDTFDWRTASGPQLLEKTGILNAYYLPGADAAGSVSGNLTSELVPRGVQHVLRRQPAAPAGPDAAPRVGHAAIHVRRHHRSADGGGAVDREGGMIQAEPFWSNRCDQS